ncbi:MAG: hypothetical protein J6B80_01390 [Clostridia bacterium]|nr:hypothetical protein [Clostridia bacterium]
MFGYIRIAKGDLKVKEYELYKVVYCTLCKVMGREYSLLSRFTLSYDFTFLALLNMSIKDGCDAVEKKHCVFNPLKKCIFCKSDEDIKLPAAAAVILNYYKVLDNIQDEKGFKKLCFILVKPFFKAPYKKAARKYPQIDLLVSDYIEAQNQAEANPSCDLDMAADPTAKMLSGLFVLLSDDNSQRRVLDRLGYCIGRYIYLIDAYCDLNDDIKHNSFNPFKSRENPKELIKGQLYFCINESCKAFELLDIKKYKNILGNILYLGLEDTLLKEIDK